MPQAAVKIEAEVQEDGRLELKVPFEPGSHVVVFVVEEPHEGFGDLTAAAASSFEFWDNPLDDEDWNDA